MTLTKSLLLGSAAALVAVASAQAADLPSKKAAPAQYVKICDAAGAGYFYIPGSDTCLKISGYVEVDAHGQNVASNATASYNNNPAQYAQHAFDISIDAELTTDTVTKTSYGDLTTHLALETEAGAPGSFNVGGGNTNTYLDKAYLTFAGLTAGKVETLFNHVESGYNHAMFNPDFSVYALQYTASFGGGFSATISVEDSKSNATGIGGYEIWTAGNRMPDVVGQLAVKQGWGEAGIDAAYHNAEAWGDTSSSTKINGYGLGAYAKINLPTLAAGDFIGFQVNYDKNAIAFSGLTRSSQRFGGWDYDGYYSNNYDHVIDENGVGHDQTGWNALVDFQHNWSPTVSTTIGGSYGQNRYSDNGSYNDYSFDYNVYAIGQVTKWTPVKGLEFGIDTTYIRYEDKPCELQYQEINKKSSDFQVDFRVIRSF